MKKIMCVLAMMCFMYGCPPVGTSADYEDKKGIFKIEIKDNNLRNRADYHPWVPSSSRRGDFGRIPPNPAPSYPLPAMGC